MCKLLKFDESNLSKNEGFSILNMSIALYYSFVTVLPLSAKLSNPLKKCPLGNLHLLAKHHKEHYSYPEAQHI